MTHRDANWRGIYSRGQAEIGGSVARREDANCSFRSGGCGKCDTRFDHGDNGNNDVVVFNELANSGDAANAESGTSAAQTLSKSHSSAICRTRSIVVVVVENDGDHNRRVFFIYALQRYQTTSDFLVSSASSHVFYATDKHCYTGDHWQWFRFLLFCEASSGDVHACSGFAHPFTFLSTHLWFCVPLGFCRLRFSQEKLYHVQWPPPCYGSSLSYDWRFRPTL